VKIAVLHNYLEYIGGAERVALTLARELGADIYATVANQRAIELMGFHVKPKTIGWVPANAPLRQQLTMWRYRMLDLTDEYDLFIIDGDWAMSAAVKNKPNMWYVHSPIREIWDLYDYTRESRVPWYARHVFDIWVNYNRIMNLQYIKHVGKIACNSQNTRQRVKKYLNRDSAVIYPPIETSDYKYKASGDFWLSVNRLITHKRVEMQMEAFSRMPEEKLVVVGCYEKSRQFLDYTRRLKRIKPKNVEILENVGYREIIDLYARCRGFITTALDEDFGMAPVEAMAAGKPVIAPKDGGYLETVIDGKTGVLIEDIDAIKLSQSIQQVGENPEAYKASCMEQAAKFDTKLFIKNVKDAMSITEVGGKDTPTNTTH